ncbi:MULTISPECIES: DUF1847 domain-containing protein [unclassified Oceanispirochaeta]|uniref:DUF1847 domain-containing protein n=1 Tax=unclassified Oceanispirochaeta TaxID=2635722 RepID=UPI000E096C3E|nr:MULTISPECIES: DUF1847 domain-containing protein [unclassified Oceanispirochaeta]MBF9017717.1 DUF1847 domain-containing protein [Oceanispirochaeta sp. M2]NPD72120.1 DUF1847 domain-containing protein [Oceanispirochaeta sp. M1]RDG32562.1 DUF1847 domain-containing protein [Oceanispirochaeta sp. M1]
MKNCLDCSDKSCRKNGADCFGLKEKSLDVYSQGSNLTIVKSSSTLVDNGRAGELSRFQEVVEFCQLQGYKNIGLAYCFGLESLAQDIRSKMNGAGLNLVPARCSMGGVKESDINPEKSNEVYSCNPAGQAEFLNRNADFVIEVGLCLGHDVIFHQQLKVPFTVQLVKDRVYAHCPLEGIKNYS